MKRRYTFTFDDEFGEGDLTPGTVRAIDDLTTDNALLVADCLKDVLWILQCKYENAVLLAFKKT